MTVPIFQTYAPEYAAAGLTVLPTGKKDGKVPLVPHWRKFGPRSHVRFLDKFANANIAIVDGKEVTRVDIDDPDLIDSAIKRFGETPIKVSTPSGGLHLWYRANGERRQTRIAAIRNLGLDHQKRGRRAATKEGPPSPRPSPRKRLMILASEHEGHKAPGGHSSCRFCKPAKAGEGYEP